MLKLLMKHQFYVHKLKNENKILMEMLFIIKLFFNISE